MVLEALPPGVASPSLALDPPLLALDLPPAAVVERSASPVVDDESLGALLDARRQAAFNLAFRLVRRSEGAADVVQDAYVLALRAARSDTAAPRDRTRFGSWLLKIVANVALGQLRRRRPEGISSLDDLPYEP